MQTWFFDSPDPEHTFECAAQLGRSIGAEGLALALVGPLGAGKTVFVKGLAEGLGVDPRIVSSPTFVIAQQYAIPAGPETLHHVDLYRLESADELDPIGFDDMLAGGQVLAVEWADRFPDVFGAEFLRIEFEGPSTAEEDAAREGVAWRGRRARVTAHGDDAERVLADWARRIDEEKSSVRISGSGGHVTALRSSPEMRVLLMLVLGIGLGLLNAVEFGDAPFRCESLNELESDGLGTLRARCSDRTTEDAGRLSGIARLLDGGKVDVNRASVPLLRSIPQLGPSRAEAIVRARSSRGDGGFSSIEELVSVPGIGRKTLERIERWLFAAGPESSSTRPELEQRQHG